jgi:glycosyltransferase involved in cell wall biosynthesis
MHNKIILSIRLMVYNNLPYIREALDGILMQHTNFAYEVVIGDDFSTDGTLEILQEYHKKYPNIIRILDRPINGEYYVKRKKTGRLYNFTDIISNCKGKYIALLDGDDAWSDVNKLQQQVDFLENNPKYILTFHDYLSFYENGNPDINDRITNRNHSDCTNFELLRGVHILPSTVVFRNVLNPFPDEFYKVHNGDIFLFTLLGNYGAGKYLKEISPTLYRVHTSGLWSSDSTIQKVKKNIYTFKTISSYYKRIGNFEISEHFKKRPYRILFIYINDFLTKPKNYSQYITLYFKILSEMIGTRQFRDFFYLQRITLRYFFRVNNKN